MDPSPSLAAPTKRTIPIRNVWFLLLYAWDLTAWRGTLKGAVERSPNLLCLLARVLADATHELLRRNLTRSFSPRAESIRGVRGRIDFAQSLKRLDFEAGRAHCHFSTLDVDTVPNRIIRSTLERLSHDRSMEDRAAAELRQDLRGLVRAMDDVRSVRVTSTLFRQLQIGRNDRAYGLPLAVCALVQRLEMPTEQTGDHLLAALLDDEVLFSDLFERFLRNFWRTHLTDHEVAREELSWFDELGCALMPSMRTDITITQRAAPHRRMVIDAKYYKHALAAGQYGNPRFISNNLYQIYAYLRTQEHRGHEFATAEGMLIYPTTTMELNESMRVQGHRIRVATVNLAAPWPDIEERLLQLRGPSLDVMQAAASSEATG